jgi:hypothetical protein
MAAADEQARGEDMRTVRMVFEYVVAMLIVSASATSLYGQAVSGVAKFTSIAVNLAMQQDHVPAGQSPVAVLTMRNISEHVIEETGDLDRYRVHVAGKNKCVPMHHTNCSRISKLALARQCN